MGKESKHTHYIGIWVTGNDPVHPQHTQPVFHVTQKKPHNPQSPLTLGWMKKWYMSTGGHFSAAKKHGVMPSAATQMDLEGATLSAVSQAEKEKYMTSLT